MSPKSIRASKKVMAPPGGNHIWDFRGEGNVGVATERKRKAPTPPVKITPRKQPTQPRTRETATRTANLNVKAQYSPLVKSHKTQQQAIGLAWSDRVWPSLTLPSSPGPSVERVTPAPSNFSPTHLAS